MARDTMRVLALLYDIHGNLAALDAVLEDAGRRGATRHFLGGDMTGLGPWPAETLARIRGLDDATQIRGNWERWTAHPDEAVDDSTVQAAIVAAYEALGDATVREMAALPESAQLAEGTRAWHGSPAGDMRSFMPEPAADERELLEGVTDRRLVFGHTHLPFARTADNGVELVNPGSVGLPLDGDQRASYALLHGDGTIEHHRVDYDHTQTAATLRERFGGAAWAETMAQRVEQARMDV